MSKEEKKDKPEDVVEEKEVDLSDVVEKVKGVAKNQKVDKSPDTEGNPPHPFEAVFEPLDDKIREAIMGSSFQTLEDLQLATDKDIKAIKGIGKRSISVIRGLLAQAGYGNDAEEELEGEKGMSNAKFKDAKIPHPSTVEVRAGGLQGDPDNTVRMRINMMDRNAVNRAGEPVKAFKSIGDVVWGNQDPAADLGEKYVKELLDRGEAVGNMKKEKKGKGKK